MEIDYINGPKTDSIFGMSRYQAEIHNRMKGVDFNVIEYKSLTKAFELKYKSIFPVKSVTSPNQSSGKIHFTNNMFNGLINVGKDFSNSIDRYRYSNLVKKNIKEANVKHITYQDLGYLLNSIKLEKSIITCHDLIPWVYDKNRSSFWKNNLNGLKKADRIITVSEFSKREIIKYLNYPKENIHIVYPAVDHKAYKKMDIVNTLNKGNITKNENIILYVGSEEPRQNLDLLISAFKKLKMTLPDVKLLKIGNPHLYGAREKLLKQIDYLGLQKDVIFLDFVEEKELPLRYNSADLMVYPCSYAGFGLPPLEAMACGTPVITSNTTSLPEVVGDAGIMVNPSDINELADNMYEVITNDGLSKDMAKKGLKRAKLFNWDESAQKTLQIYEEML